MGPLLLVLLFPLPCVSGLPFYNGFYYSNSPNGWNPGNGHGEGGRPPGSGSMLRWGTRTSPGSCCDMQPPGRDRGQGVEPEAPSLSGPLQRTRLISEECKGWLGYSVFASPSGLECVGAESPVRLRTLPKSCQFSKILSVTSPSVPSGKGV